MPIHSVATRTLLLALLPAVVWGADSSQNLAPSAPPRHWRHPVAILQRGDRLFVANQRGGSVSRIDLDTWQVRDEKVIGRSLSDLVALADGRLLATDELAEQVVLFSESADNQFVIHQRLNVAAKPVSVVASLESDMACVASLWSRRLTLLNLRNYQIDIAGTIDLPFAPRLQRFLPDGQRLVVADAFGGRLAIVDTASQRLQSIRSIEGHNIRGLEIDPTGKNLLIAHQLMTSGMPTIPQRISWGQIIDNLLRTVALEELLAGGPDTTAAEAVRPIAHWTLEPLGENKHGAGDPGALALTPLGKRIVCLSGVNQIGIGSPSSLGFQRVAVGRRPTALSVDPRRQCVYVANTYDDSISVVDLAHGEVVETIALGETPKMSLADRGERLFYDATLTLDGWYSCHSCHTDGHSNGLLNDNLGDNTLGTPKRVLSLLGVNSTEPWGWNGSQAWISSQVARSLRTTMRHHAVEQLAVDGGVEAISDFLRFLPPPPSLLKARGEPIDTPAIARGRELFHLYDCQRCHAPSVYTTDDTYDVGLRDEAGMSKFNPPSLRGVSQQYAWLHDCRARTLRDVFAEYGHPNESTLDLSPEDIDDLVQFLKSL